MSGPALLIPAVSRLVLDSHCRRHVPYTCLHTYGSSLLCRDLLFTRLVSPQIELDLEGTLMEGKPSCVYRWQVKS